MKIASYIADLLYEYEYVVIPGLGGFITRDHGVSVHPVRHYFKPPYREIVFNPRLQNNDGLLLSYIARNENLSYLNARSQLDLFVKECLSMMKEGKQIYFNQIGKLYLNEQQEISFDADTNINYLPEAFGLEAVISPPVKREGMQQKIGAALVSAAALKTADPSISSNTKAVGAKEAAATVAATSSGRRIYRRLSVAAVILVLFGLFGLLNKQFVQHYYDVYTSKASALPWFYASPNEYIIKNSHWLQSVKIFGKSETSTAQTNLSSLEESPSNSVEQVVEQPETQVETEAEELLAEAFEEAEPAEVMPIYEVPENKYFIIAGVFREKSNADNLVKQLQDKGYLADYLGQTANGMWRVCFEGHPEHQPAINRLHIIRREENPQAWIFTK